jgi:hypothetical protein
LIARESSYRGDFDIVFRATHGDMSSGVRACIAPEFAVADELAAVKRPRWPLPQRSHIGKRQSGDSQLAKLADFLAGQVQVPSESYRLAKQKATLNDFERNLRDRLEEQDNALARAADLGQQFRKMIQERRQGELADWLSRAQAVETPAEIRSFAKGLADDARAVQAALHFEWSNGQVEGQVNRLKTEVTNVWSSGL